MATIKKETLEVLKNKPKAAQLSPSDSLNVYIGVADKFKNKTQEGIDAMSEDERKNDMMDFDNPGSMKNKLMQYMQIHQALMKAKKDNKNPEDTMDETGKMFYKNLIQKYGNKLIDSNIFDEYLNVGKGQNIK
jgi:FKBP-type peptidyl-prolyl cis-trans isomerase